jgi:hypothetical protein
MNMTLKRHMDGNMLHNWCTTIPVPDVSQNETNSRLFLTYRPGTNFQTSCQCVTHLLASQSSGLLEAFQLLGFSQVMDC